jgi:hypothetical protein
VCQVCRLAFDGVVVVWAGRVGGGVGGGGYWVAVPRGLHPLRPNNNAVPVRVNTHMYVYMCCGLVDHVQPQVCTATPRRRRDDGLGAVCLFVHNVSIHALLELPVVGWRGASPTC